MEFRVLLKELQAEFADNEFLTAEVLARVYGASWLDEKMPSSDVQEPTNRVPTLKMASKDLDRLFKMNFLIRRRTKRQVNTSNGKPCYRGYNYVYKISAQGRKYIAYLNDPEGIRKNELRQVRGFEDLMFHAYLKKRVGSELESGEVTTIYQSMFPRNETSIERRFPIRKNTPMVQLASKLLKDNRKYKQELRNSKQELENNKILELEEDIQGLKKGVELTALTEKVFGLYDQIVAIERDNIQRLSAALAAKSS